MAEADLRSQLFSEVQEARSQLLAAIDGLSEEQMVAQALDGWSAKDHLAHIAAWDELRFHEINRVARGDRPAFADITPLQVDAFNSWTIDLRREFSTAQVLRELELTRSRVLEAVGACPDSRLGEAAEGRGRIRRAAAHDLEHAALIREWRQREGI